MQLSTENLSEEAINNINKWLTEPKYVEYRSELEALINAGEWEQLEDAFFKVIEFGTGGRRGKTGVGSNRVNKVTIGESAQALCEYALSFDDDAPKKGIVIACDTRLSSPELSKVAAEVVAGNGFKTYIFDNFRATPELSFAIRHLECVAGIVISASHNPSSDNGFKAYWSDGGQLVPPHDKGVLDMAEKVSMVKSIDFNKAVDEGQVVIIGKEVDDAYINAVIANTLGQDRDINIVYSPLHGTGQTSVLPALRAAGFEKISLVESQMSPDGNFPNVPGGKPNPEEPLANDAAIKQLMDERADIAITNDPDADRIGVFIRQGDNPVSLTGNQSAVLATDYALKKLKQKGVLTSNHYIVKTIVTTDMLNSLAEYYGVKIYDNLLIGFKYIGELIKNKEDTDEKFVIGGEESYGLLMGTYARDKDAATGALPVIEYAAELKRDGKTLYDKLLELYEQHGVFVEKLNTMVCPGATGFEQMQRIMAGLRESAPKKIGDHEVTAVIDYKTLEHLDVSTGKISPIDCLSGNVFVLEFGDKRRRITVRPSGTEPKLKFYIQWFEEADKTKLVKDQYEQIEEYLAKISKELESILSTI